jgi:hypothetical protein
VRKIHVEFDLEARKYDNDDNEVQLTPKELAGLEEDIEREVFGIQNMGTDLNISVFGYLLEEMA